MRSDTLQNLFLEGDDAAPRSLAAAVVRQAIQDGKHGDSAAQVWLLLDGLVWMEGLNINVDREQLARLFNHNRKARQLERM